MVGAVRGAWPWAVLVWLVVWCCWPLLTGGDRIFIGRISTDAAVTLWFYDLVARSAVLPYTLSEFDWPEAWTRGREFPSAVDAAMVAPIGRLVDWPGRWGVIQTVVVGGNALGAALLARAVGCRGAAVVVAGGLALLNRQLWFDLVAARMNAVWPGLAAAALGAWLLSLSPHRTLMSRLVVVGAAAWLGALAGAVYPPYLAMLAPVGLILGLGMLRQQRWRGLLWGLVSLVFSLLWIGEDLVEMTALRSNRQLSALACPDNVHALDVAWLARPDALGGLSLPGVSLAAWVLVPLALLHPRRRSAILIAVIVAVLMVLSLGPCPSLNGVALPEWETLNAVGLWRLLERLTDYGRLASMAAILLALLSALGVDALRRLWPPLSMVVAGAVLAWGTGLLMTEIQQPDKWHSFTVPLTAEFLATAAPGPVAELPFDRSMQFLSVIDQPDRPRVNPLKAGPRLQSNAFVGWLLQIGQGKLEEGDFDGDDVRNSGVRWVLMEPARCEVESVPDVACGPEAIALLEARLGAPAVEAGGLLLVWSLEGVR
ncbi:MAG: hypothetical protein ACI8RZ_000638 [Myxococcota bacterium]